MIRGSAFTAYLRQRFKFTVFGPAIALHAAAAVWAGGSMHTLRSTLAAVALIALLILQFRLWDDLEDRERDRAVHPERILSGANPAPFWRALIALTIANMVVVTVIGSLGSFIALALLNLSFWVAYRHIRPRVPDPTWRYQVLLLKYPAFVALVANRHILLGAGRAVAACVVVYACACAYEALHDRSRPPLGVIS